MSSTKRFSGRPRKKPNSMGVNKDEYIAQTNMNNSHALYHLFEGLMIQGCSLGPSESSFRCSGESSHRNDSAKLNLPLLVETSSFISSSAILSCCRRRHPINLVNLSYFSIDPNLARGNQHSTPCSWLLTTPNESGIQKRKLRSDLFTVLCSITED